MFWSNVPFKRYKGKTLPQIVFTDPDYFFWFYDNKKFPAKLHYEADYIYQRATSIKVPGIGEKEIEYIFRDDKFASLRLVDKSTPPPVCDHSNNITKTFRLPVIDLGAIRGFKNYNKAGHAKLISEFKNIFFGKHNYVITKQRCEAFFEDANNFDLGSGIYPNITDGFDDGGLSDYFPITR